MSICKLRDERNFREIHVLTDKSRNWSKWIHTVWPAAKAPVDAPDLR